MIGLGSNLGDRKGHLDAAIAALAATPGILVRAVSRAHETAPVGGPPGQGAFLNAAAAVETGLAPEHLLHALHVIEQRSGRVRTTRWGERTLDLDLLLYGDHVIDNRPVVNRVFGGRSIPFRVPHPRMSARRFVLAPLAEIAPGVIDPLTGRTIAGLLANLDRRPSLVAIHGPRLEDAFHARLGEKFHAVKLVYSQPERERSRPATREPFEFQWFEQLLREATNEPGTWLESLLGRVGDELNIDRWPIDAWSDRWLVTDFWFDSIYELAGLSVPDPSPSLDRILEARARIIAPTFVVVPEGRRSSFCRSGRTWPAPLGDAPILEMNFVAPVEVMAAEVLAACRATRTG